jgi:adenylate cyclase class IV
MHTSKEPSPALQNFEAFCVSGSVYISSADGSPPRDGSIAVSSALTPLPPEVFSELTTVSRDVVAGRPDVPPATPTAGHSATFFEARFKPAGELNIMELAANNKIEFLGTAREVDEFYEVPEGIEALAAGTYRVRETGSASTVLTQKTHTTCPSGAAALTHDIVNPPDELLAQVRDRGRLLGVVEKDRHTYRSTTFPGCLVHHDAVAGLGTFLDLKAPSEVVLTLLVQDLGLESFALIQESYVDLALRQGLSPTRLAAWRFQQSFSDYILGVVSGTLTPVGLLSVTAIAGGSQVNQIMALLSAGLCDGLSDSVAAAQATQSDSRASWSRQLGMFCKTMAGKVVIPLTFIPSVLLSDGPVQTCALAALWGSTLLAGTATVQALAHGKSVAKEVSKSVGFGLTAISIGATAGQVLPPVLTEVLGWFGGK